MKDALEYDVLILLPLGSLGLEANWRADADGHASSAAP
jgi:hypothetical protein